MRTVGHMSLCLAMALMIPACQTSEPGPATAEPGPATAPAGEVAAVDQPAPPVYPAAGQIYAPTPTMELVVTGTVSDANGQPVEAATVELYEGYYHPIAWMQFRRLASAVTGADGQYGFETQAGTIPVTQCIVVARKAGLACDWQGISVDMPRRVQAPLQLGAEAVLSGVVVDEEGQGLPNVIIRPLMQAQIGTAFKQLIPTPDMDWPAVRTDAEGRFELRGLPVTANVELDLNAPGRIHMTTLPAGGDEHTPWQSGATDVRVVLPQGASVVGQVVDEQGGGVSGVMVVASPRTTGGPLEMASAVSDSEGGFRLDGLRPAEYGVGLLPPLTGPAPWAAAPQSVATKAGEAAQNIQLDLTRGGLLEIDVLRGQEPAAQAYVHVAGAGTVIPVVVRTDEQGRHTLRAQSGQWRILAVMTPGYLGDELPPMAEVQADQTTRMTVLLKPRPLIAGTVRDVDGQPVAGVAVQLLHKPALTATTDEQGRFTFDYDSSATSENYKDSRTLYIRKGDLVAGQTLRDTDLEAVALTMAPGPVIVGEVTDTDGNPVAAAEIDVLAFGSQWTLPLGRPAVTDDQGRYVIATLPAGIKYRLMPVAEGYGQVQVTVEPAAQPGEEFRAPTVVTPKADQSLTGQVVDDDGTPVPNVKITVYGQHQPAREAQADAQGYFRVEGVIAGPLILTAGSEAQGAARGRLEVSGGQRDVEVVLQHPSRPSRAKPTSQLDKPLKDLGAFGLSVPPEWIEGKRVLVAFWSMKHSGAVDAIRELGRQAEAFQELGVVIVTVLTSEEPDDQVKAWLAENGIKLPYGRMPNQPRQQRETQRNWGLFNLPWLLLTDTSHVVRAEGTKLQEVLQTLEGYVPATAPATEPATAPATTPATAPLEPTTRP